MAVIEIDTDRLRLRQWRDNDRSPLYAMSADAEVMRYFPSTLDHKQCDELFEFCQSFLAKNGWGIWAVELQENQQFIGFAGLNHAPDSLKFSPCIEILWRLARPFWGKGYASEAANAILKIGFEQVGLTEIYSFAVMENHKSRAVMERIGMLDTGVEFRHPELSKSSSLSKHFLYKITQDQWISLNN